MKLDIKQRRAGLFCPLFAIRTEGDLGIGDVASLGEMVTLCVESGMSVLQLLPINETSDDNSPYNAISSMALEPVTLKCSVETVPGLAEKDLGDLVPAELLKKLNQGPVSYREVKRIKRELCAAAFHRLESEGWSGAWAEEFAAFQEAEKGWLEDYVAFRTIMEKHGGNPVWQSWEEAFRSAQSAKAWESALPEAERKEYLERKRFFAYVQWVLHRQWDKAKQEAEAAGVYLTGDMPFGVSKHSADVWAEPEIFELNWSGGAPPEPAFKPDRFTEVWGQNWGVPVYNWARMREENFSWWRRRVGGIARFFHLFRIDHVLGFYRIYAFPWPPDRNQEVADMEPEAVKLRFGALPQFLPGSDVVPEQAAMNQEQGEEILKVVLEAAGKTTILAEDLGMVPDYVRPSLQKLGISGFKIPLFERYEDSREFKNPEEYPELSISTLSTHDHETMAGQWEIWWNQYEQSQHRDATASEIEAGRQAGWDLYRSLRLAKLDDRELIRSFVPEVMEGLSRRLLDSASWLSILSITDALALKIRFNVPGPVAESNWSERLPLTVKDIQRAPLLRGYLQKLKQLAQNSGRK